MTQNQIESPTFFVIGCNSFSGASFVNYLLDKSIAVIGISRSEQPESVFLPYADKDLTKFQFHQMDINNDLDKIMDLIKSIRPEYVVNFAAQGMVAESWDSPEDWYRTNTVGTIKLHDQLRKCDFLKKYVHVSTPEVYGNCEGLVTENLHYEPSTPYAVSRAAADMSLMSFNKAYDFPVVFTRSANVYGAGQQLYRIIPRTILYILLGKKLELHGGGTSVRSFIHIDDVSEGTYQIAIKSPPGNIYHLSTSDNISIRALVEKIVSKMNVSFDDHVDIVGERMGKDAAYLLDNQKIKKDLGWNDVISLDEGIDDTIAWVSKNIDVLREQSMSYIHKQ